MIVTDPRLRGWIEPRLGMTLDADAQFLGAIKGSAIVAVVAFTHYTDTDIEISVAAERGAGTRRFIAATFGYVFDQLGCARCTVRMRASNERSVRLAKRLGFHPEGVLRAGYGDEDALILGLTRNDYGKRRTKATPGSRSHEDHLAGKPVQPLQPDQSVWVGDVVNRPRWAADPYADPESGGCSST